MTECVTRRDSMLHAIIVVLMCCPCILCVCLVLRRIASSIHPSISLFLSLSLSLLLPISPIPCGKCTSYSPNFLNILLHFISLGLCVYPPPLLLQQRHPSQVCESGGGQGRRRHACGECQARNRPILRRILALQNRDRIERGKYARV